MSSSQPPDPGDLARVHLAPLVSSGAVPSLAWAVVQDGDVHLGGFGGAGPRTIFQVGSVTKVFTALLLADMTERGEVRLPDPARSTPRPPTWARSCKPAWPAARSVWPGTLPSAVTAGSSGTTA